MAEVRADGELRVELNRLLGEHLVPCGVHRVCEEFLARKRVVLSFRQLRRHLLERPFEDLGRLPAGCCWRVMFAYVERQRNFLAYRGATLSDLDASALDAVRLCVLPVDWAVLSKWSVTPGASRLPTCMVVRSAFVAYQMAPRVARFVLDSWEAVLLFAKVYRDLVRDLPEPAVRARVEVALSWLPHFQSHPEGAKLVLDNTQRVVFLDVDRKLAHRHALAAAAWDAEMSSWRARGRCGRERTGGHDCSKVLDRKLTPFRYFALFECYSLCIQCGARNVVRPLAWPLASSLPGCGPVFFSDWVPQSGVLHRCRWHSVKKNFDYAVPHLMAQSPVPGSAPPALRWTYWPRYPPS